jgi:hypothetical protein
VFLYVERPSSELVNEVDSRRRSSQAYEKDGMTGPFQGVLEVPVGRLLDEFTDTLDIVRIIEEVTHAADLETLQHAT